MDVELIKMPAHEAKSAWRAYRDSVKEWPSAEYRALMRGYKALAQGQAVIDLFDVMKTAGVDHLHRPKLAIVNASAKFVYFNGHQNGRGIFKTTQFNDSRLRTVRLPENTFPTNKIDWWQTNYRAVVPLIPAAVRPAHDLSNYHILWEAEWERVPVDPMLLRHLSGSLYAVLATWDLTPLEQAVLKGRLLQ